MRTTKPICVSLPSDLLDRLDSVAAGEERSRSQVIARLVRNSISQIGAAVSPVAEAAGGVPVRHPAAEA